MERNPKLVIRLDTDKGEQQEDCAQQHADEGRLVNRKLDTGDISENALDYAPYS